jgi:hypothetical protein
MGSASRLSVAIPIGVRPNVMISTNIAVALELVRPGHPALDEHIPRSAYVNIDTQHP